MIRIAEFWNLEIYSTLQIAIQFSNFPILLFKIT
jgi:hypothetical protein